MHSPFENLHKSIAVPHLVTQYAHLVCVCRGLEDLRLLCLAADRSDATLTHMTAVHERLTGSTRFSWHDHINNAKQYLREHL